MIQSNRFTDRWQITRFGQQINNFMTRLLPTGITLTSQRYYPVS